MNYKILDFDIKGDERGSLIAIEGNYDIPFEIKRIYYVFGSNRHVVRGKHAHKRLEQVIICIAGSFDFIVDDGENRELIHLNKPNIGLYTPINLWGEFTNFSSDCIALVLASEKYDESEYIRNYDQFLREISK